MAEKKLPEDLERVLARASSIIASVTSASPHHFGGNSRSALRSELLKLHRARSETPDFDLATYLNQQAEALETRRPSMREKDPSEKEWAETTVLLDTIRLVMNPKGMPQLPKNDLLLVDISQEGFTRDDGVFKK